MGFLDRILGRAKDKFDGKGADSHKGNTTTEIRNENCNMEGKKVWTQPKY